MKLENPLTWHQIRCCITVLAVGLLSACSIKENETLPVNYLVDRNPIARATVQPHLTPDASTDGTALEPSRSETLAVRSSQPDSRSFGVGSLQAAQAPITGKLQEFAAVTYHRVGNDDSPYTVTPETFASQMQYLENNNYNVVSLKQILNHFELGVALPERAILITVDDGHKSSYAEIYPVLTRHRFSAVYFPYSDYINNGGVTRSMMREMVRSSLAEFQLHSRTHAALTLKEPYETDEDYRHRILGELLEPVDHLESITGQKPVALAYPYGKVNRVVEGLVRKAGIKVGFTVNCAKNTRQTRRTRLNRCTITAEDSIDDFARKLGRPVYVHRLAKAGASVTGRASVRDSDADKYSPARFFRPEFLGKIAHREVFRNVPIEPFSGYFLDAAGDGLHYRVNKLPNGLVIDQETGVISGIPGENASDTLVTVIATDKRGSKSVSNTFRISVY